VSAAQPADTAARLVEEYRRHCAIVPPPTPAPPRAAESPDDATRERLRALGYVE